MDSKKKINRSSPKIRVLVCPLEWGLGHAARCIPVIKELLLYDCEVFVGAEGAILSLLEIEFPQINFLPLAGYRIKFSKNNSFILWKIASQFPRIIYTIYNEKRWLKKMLKQYKINAVISDNRFGLYNRSVICIYITHQLLIKTGNIFTSKIAQRIHHYFINKYDECWVPDFFGKDNLAGELSHPLIVPENVRYIGGLSRFEKKEKVAKKYDLIIILSGPEPQRTFFEEKLLDDLLFFNEKTLIIRGLPGNIQSIQSGKQTIEIINHLSANKLCEAIQQADIVISRSGYTTVMDLIKLNKKAILIPTPGQTEQEYLAHYLKEKNIFFSVNQEDFNLINTLEEFSKFQCTIPVFDMEEYKSSIQSFLDLIKSSIPEN
ncbi:MAG: glycosyltransferase [Ginsengibacter sp.]